LIKIKKFKVITNNMYNKYKNLSLYNFGIIIINNEDNNNNYNNFFKQSSM